MAEFRWPPGFPLNGLEAVRELKRPPQNPRAFDWGPWQKADTEMGDGLMVEWAVRFLEQPREPFSLPQHHGLDVNIGGNAHGAPGTHFFPWQGNWKIPGTGQRAVWNVLPDGRPGEYLTDRLTDAEHASGSRSV